MQKIVIQANQHGILMHMPLKIFNKLKSETKIALLYFVIEINLMIYPLLKNKSRPFVKCKSMVK